jgi:hypothetical protein
VTVEELVQARQLGEVFGTRALAKRIAELAAQAADDSDPEVAKLGRQLRKAIGPLANWALSRGVHDCVEDASLRDSKRRWQSRGGARCSLLS